jgi:hypothetical protein
MNETAKTFLNICFWSISAAYVALAVVTAATLVWVVMIH